MRIIMRLNNLRIKLTLLLLVMNVDITKTNCFKLSLNGPCVNVVKLISITS